MKHKLLLALSVSLGIYGCQSNPQSNMQRDLSVNEHLKSKVQSVPSNCVTANFGTYQSVLAHPKQGWSECFNHQQPGLFESVVNRIDAIAKSNQLNDELDSLLYYLRAYSYFTDLNELKPAQWQTLNDALTSVSKMKALYADNKLSYRTLEHLYVALFQFAGHKNNASAASLAVNVLERSLLNTHVLPKQQDIQQQYQLLELYRSIGFLAYEARSIKALKAALTEGKLATALQQHLTKLTADDWQLSNALWAAANLHYIQSEIEQKKMDEKVSEILFSHSALSSEQQKQRFSQNYLVNSFRYHEQCDDEFAGKCSIPNIDEFLPINHQCSDSLFIRATQMTIDELNTTCTKLTSQETFFHQTINSQNQPVSNDLNTKLRVVIFDNYSEYNRWGQLFFNIGTDNGGMYIEGTPEKAGNQATFYSFEAFWQQPTFSVWNLNHEYVHYLDGRFVKFGTYGHFPSHLVWWSEGLAEYVSVQKQNKRAFTLLNKTPQEEWPSLDDIFATSYADGVDRVYRWSYQAIRFIFENYPTSGHDMAQALKQDDFDLYRRLQDDFARTHQAEFRAWQLANKPNKKDNKVIKRQTENYTRHPLYRYLYRSYLRPQHLPVNAQHQHFENWG